MVIQSQISINDEIKTTKHGPVAIFCATASFTTIFILLAATLLTEFIGRKVEDKNMHLLAREMHIPAADFLYVFAALEQKTRLPVVTVLEQHDFTVFTIHNLAAEISKLQ